MTHCPHYTIKNAHTELVGMLNSGLIDYPAFHHQLRILGFWI
ncbi:MAG: hypothetical protein RSE62_03370 [Citrobacter sp.]